MGPGALLFPAGHVPYACMVLTAGLAESEAGCSWGVCALTCCNCRECCWFAVRDNVCARLHLSMSAADACVTANP